MFTRLMTFAMVLLLAGAWGCGKSAEDKLAEKMIEAQSGGKADVDISGGKMTIKTKEGTVAIDAAGVSVPETFPKDVPIPGSTKIVSSVSTGDGVMLNLESSKSIADAVKEFSDSMKANGWSEESSFNAGEQAMVAFKKDERTTALIVTRVDGKTTIGLTAELAK